MAERSVRRASWHSSRILRRRARELRAGAAARRRDGDIAGEAYMLTILGKACCSRRRAAGARLFECAAILSRQHGNRAPLALALYHQGIARAGLGDTARALEVIRRRSQSKRNHTAGSRPDPGRIGDAHVIESNSPRRRPLRASKLNLGIDDPRGPAGGLMRTARLNLELGRHQAAIDAFRRAEIRGGWPAGALAPALSAWKGVRRRRRRARALDHGRRAVGSHAAA